MERLTQRCNCGICGSNERVVLYPLYKIGGDEYTDYGLINQCFEKLAMYEDLEEQGLLVRLPCKVGDTLYCVGTECLANIAPDEECDLFDCDECGHNKKWVVFERTATKYFIGVLMGYGMLSNFEYKKNVFLTREEAEAALEKMKGEEHEV